MLEVCSGILSASDKASCSLLHGSSDSVPGAGTNEQSQATMLLPPWHLESCTDPFSQKNKLHPHIHRMSSLPTLVGLGISHKPSGSFSVLLFFCLKFIFF